MKVIKSEDGLTTKFLHDNGNETSIKLEYSGKFDTNLNLEKQDNNKYSMVLSCSKGCIMKCGFCFLTQKKAEHHNVSTGVLLSNMKEALLYQVRENPEMVNKYIKLCYMGEGDALFHTYKIHDMTLKFLDWVFANKLARGLDGVDLSTVLPNIGSSWERTLGRLAEDLQSYEINPLREGKSVFRLFYSLHSANQAVRDKLIPNAMPIDKALPKLNNFSYNSGVNLVLHYMFMEGINDSEEDNIQLQVLLEKYGLQNTELRILRYNTNNNEFRESSKLTQVLHEVESYTNNLKVQYSSGDEVLSACGMFVVV